MTEQSFGPPWEQPTEVPVADGTGLADQPSPWPTPKLVAGVSTGTLTIGVLWLARHYGLDLPPELGEAIVVAAGGAAAWIKRNRGHLLERLVDACDDDEPGEHAADR
jgi:hypothetical protein